MSKTSDNPAEMTAQPVLSEVRTPGESGFWIVILGDLTAFALLFCVFIYHRGMNVELFSRSQATLDRGYGAFNMLLLLTSSLFVVNGVAAFRDRETLRSRRSFGTAFLLGAGFVLVKILEYRDKVHAGIVPTSNDFYMFYFVLTGIHLLHLLIGLGAIAWMRSKARSGWKTPGEVMLVECGGLYWHMVDLLWVALFSLLYLLG